MNKIDSELLETITDLHSLPEGSFNIRKNGKLLKRNSNDDISIVSKTDADGIDIYVKKGLKGKSVHIPVLLTEAGLVDSVINDFHIGEDADVLIVAGCGIHTDKDSTSHNGYHNFYLENGAKVRYVERHVGVGKKAEKIFNPKTVINMKNNCEFIMETSQLGGVSKTVRETFANLGDDSKLIVKEKILTTDEDDCVSNFVVNLNGKNSSCEVVSRGVARGESHQAFSSTLIGNNACFGHVECDAILTDKSHIVSTPKIEANCIDASLVHEAAIGKIAKDQIVKLMTMGLNKDEAEKFIINGFLK